jgi:glycosyltransferase involved in cell wall biosynthesis
MENKLSTIGILHFIVGGTDGVSLEINKWKRVLEDMGHTVYLCAGDLGALDGTLVEELYHHRPDIERINVNTFIALNDFDSEAAYRTELERLASLIEEKVGAFLDEKGIDFFIPQNVWANSVSPPATLAIARLIRKRKIPSLAHHHDFYWERIDGVALTSATAIELADKCMPPREDFIQHVVINSLAREELMARKGIPSTVIPNVFDFSGEGWHEDDYNQDLRDRIGLSENDIFILQATRIVPKKGIELAIDLVSELNKPHRRAIFTKSGLFDGRPFTDDSKIVLVLPGITADEITGTYVKKLKEKIELSGIEAHFIEDFVDGSRREEKGQKVYSLWDTYVAADFVTYPSQWEGWGNQFLEAVHARLPMMIFEYPVYQSDIKEAGFKVISLGSETAGLDNLGLVQVDPSIINRAADQAMELLINPEHRDEIVTHNYGLGARRFSLEALQDHLMPLVDAA